MSYQVYCPKCNKHLGGVALADEMDPEAGELIKNFETSLGRQAMAECNEYVCNYE